MGAGASAQELSAAVSDASTGDISQALSCLESDARAKIEKVLAEQKTSEQAKGPTIELKVGGEPHRFNGWHNSTGYVWSYEVADESIVQTLETKGTGQVKYGDGGGREFEYEFHALAPGVTKVKISHARPWEKDSDLGGKSFTIHAVQPAEEELQGTLSKARSTLEELAARVKDLRPDHPGNFELEGGIDQGSVGIQLFHLRKAIYRAHLALKVILREDAETAKMAELKAKETKLRAEQQEVRSSVADLRKQLDALQTELQDITGEPVRRKLKMMKCQREEQLRENASATEKKEAELRSFEVELQGDRDEMKSLEQEVVDFTEKVKMAKAAKADA